MQPSGYKNWKFLPFENGSMESRFADYTQALLEATLVNNGVSADFRSSLQIELAQAQLKIDREEASSGAGHEFADGKTFYRYEISMNDPQGVAYLTFLAMLLGKGTVSASNPPTLAVDFRENPVKKLEQLSAALAQLYKSTNKPQQRPSANTPG